MKTKTNKKRINYLVVGIVALSLLVGAELYNRITDPVIPLGASITNIAGTDKLSDSRSVINTNFSNLNSGKMEVSTTSVASITALANLVTVGTIGTGVWEGTEVDEQQGGTGLTSYATGDIIFASGSNVLANLVASSTNEVLTLVGGVPVWRDANVNEAANFTWTGLHTFANASSTLATISGTGFFTGTSLFTGAVTGANSEVANTSVTDISVFSSTASTTMFTFTVPANQLGTVDAVKLRLYFSSLRVRASSMAIFFELNYGGSKQNLSFVNPTGADATMAGYVDITLTADSSDSSQETTIHIDARQSGITTNSSATQHTGRQVETQTHAVDSTSDQTFSLIMRNNESNAGAGFTMDNIVGEYIR